MTWDRHEQERLKRLEMRFSGEPEGMNLDQLRCLARMARGEQRRHGTRSFMGRKYRDLAKAVELLIHERQREELRLRYGQGGVC